MERVKYNRTWHHPLSESLESDDKMINLDDLIKLYGTECVATEKMDGENTCIYCDGYTHARSTESGYHESRNWIKAYACQVGYLIPKDIRIYGENLYAQHSIPYTNLGTYFHGFGAYRDNYCLPYDETLELFSELGIKPVREVWRGILTPEIVQELFNAQDHEKEEGLVFRTVDGFNSDEFGSKVFKLVRANHVQTNKHWSQQEVIPNKLGS